MLANGIAAAAVVAVTFSTLQFSVGLHVLRVCVTQYFDGSVKVTGE